jgi:acetylornithine deacetylase/succinyl-diaminopimelate desuccinylase-like protein
VPKIRNRHSPTRLLFGPPAKRVAALLVAVGLISSLLAGTANAVWPFGAANSVDGHGQLAAELLSDLIRTKTVNPPGGEAAAAALLAERLIEAGIETRLIPTPTAPGQPDRAALWAMVPGSGERAPLILLSHLDVVPATAEEWLWDPFAGEIKDGFVHGRGALDAKGVTAIQAVTLLALAARDEAPVRDVILLATPDEEAGGRNGAGYLVKERPELLRDASYLLTEGGSIQPGLAANALEPGRPSMWGVAITEKSPCWLELTTRGTPGHGSAPRQDAAVPRLIAALDKIRRTESPIRVLSEVEEMFHALAASAPEADREGFASLATALESDPSFRRRFLSHPSYNALVRNTVSITVLQGGTRTNVVPGAARAQLDARLLPGERCSDWQQAIRDVIADPEVRIEMLLAFPSRSSAANTPLFEAIRLVAHRREKDALVVPRMIGGFTDAHWFRERGMVAYGFVPRWLAPVDTRGIHGANERVSIENLEAGVETLLEIIDALAITDADHDPRAAAR